MLTTLMIGCSEKCCDENMRVMAHFNKNAVVNLTEREIVVDGAKFIFLSAHNCIEKIKGRTYHAFIKCGQGNYEPDLDAHLESGLRKVNAKM